MNPKDHAIQLLKKHTAIGIALAEAPTIDAAASFRALSTVLAQEKKQVAKLFSGAFPEHVFSLFPKHSEETYDNEPRGDCIITVNTADAPVKEIRYERTAAGIDIILASKGRPVSEKHISVRRGAPEVGLIMTIGVSSFDELGSVFKQASDLFFEKPAIALAKDSLPETFAEVSLARGEQSAVSGVTAELLFLFAPERVTKDIATLLFFGIARETKNFDPARTKPATAKVAHELVRKGADKDVVRRVLASLNVSAARGESAAPKSIQILKPAAFLRLLGRATIRSRTDTNTGILWSLLTADDFLKTGTRAKEAVPFILEHMGTHFALPETSVFLWQALDGKTVFAAVRTNAMHRVVEPVSAPVVGVSAWRTLTEAFSDFPAAERAIQKLLQGKEKR